MTAQRTRFIILLALIRVQTLVAAEKMILRCLWLRILTKGVRVEMVLKMNTMAYKTWKLRDRILLETIVLYIRMTR